MPQERLETASEGPRPRRARHLALVALAWLGLACGAERLRIEVTVPEVYRGAVTSLRLSVLEPPALAPFGCEDLAFGRPIAAEAHRTAVQQVILDQRTTELVEIERHASKLFWLEGLQADGVAVVQACAQLGPDADLGERVHLDAEPSLELVAPSEAEIYGGELLGPALPDRVAFRVQDVLAKPIGGAQVEWQLVGPGYISPIHSSTSNAAGEAPVLVPQPTRPGPHLVEVRARWLRAPFMLRGLAPPRLLFQRDSASWTLDYAVGHLGPSGQPGFALLNLAEGAPAAVIELWFYDGVTFVQTAPPVAVPARALGVVTRADGDHIFTIVPGSNCGSAFGCWIEVSRTGAPTVSPVQPGGMMTSALHVGECAAGAADELLVRFEDGTIGAFDAAGAPRQRPFLASGNGQAVLIGAGCVVDDTGVEHRVVARRDTSGGLSVAVEAPDEALGLRVGMLAAAPLSVGFAPPLGPTPPLLIAAEIAPGGVALAEYRLRLRPLDLQLIVADREPTLPYPSQMSGGDLDADGVGDVAALSWVGTDPNRTAFFRALIVLGQTYRDRRLSALSVQEVLREPRLSTADFDGDGCDEVLTTETGVITTGTASSRLRVESLCP